MSKLTLAKRNKIPKSEFGLPDEKKYPVDTHGRAVAAKGYADQMLENGHITKNEYSRIVSRANKALGE